MDAPRMDDYIYWEDEDSSLHQTFNLNVQIKGKQQIININKCEK